MYLLKHCLLQEGKLYPEQSLSMYCLQSIARLCCYQQGPQAHVKYLDLCLSNFTIFRRLVQAQLGISPLGEGHQTTHQPSPLPRCGGPVNGVPLEVQLPHTTLLHRLQQESKKISHMVTLQITKWDGRLPYAVRIGHAYRVHAYPAVSP